MISSLPLTKGEKKKHINKIYNLSINIIRTHEIRNLHLGTMNLVGVAGRTNKAESKKRRVRICLLDIMFLYSMEFSLVCD